jgi:tripartite-type tricarboxylate transporter receptor subunit TctC
VVQFLQSGDVRALAVTTKERSPLAPDVPTFAEQGFPGYEVVEELALFAPAGTPEPILRRLNAATAAAFAAPEVRERLAVLAVSPAVGRPEEDWPAHFAAENAKWREVIRTRGITLE